MKHRPAPGEGESAPHGDVSYRYRVAVKPFRIPPVQDALVVGRRAGIGCYALRRALHLLMAAPFAHIELDDAVISDILVREAVLRRFPRNRLIAFILEQVKPLMDEEEILHLTVETEVILGAGDGRCDASGGP